MGIKHKTWCEFVEKIEKKLADRRGGQLPREGTKRNRAYGYWRDVEQYVLPVLRQQRDLAGFQEQVRAHFERGDYKGLEKLIKDLEK